VPQPHLPTAYLLLEQLQEAALSVTICLALMAIARAAAQSPDADAAGRSPSTGRHLRRRPPLFRAGADMWITGSYDPELNLIYWSTAQAKPWARAARGTDGDALCSNTTLAFGPETGKIVWYYQLIPGETHD
jgi:glucose dehydrogenase